MWVPGPGALDEEGPRAWPGRARVGVDIVGWLVVWVCGRLVLRFLNVACGGDLSELEPNVLDKFEK
jgi:hypothetical protein